MSSITDKINYLNETKNLIKQSIINKGVGISDTDSFRSYADKISAIVGSTDGATCFITNTLPPTKIAGIAYWVDAQCNTREGFNKDLTYLQPLVIGGFSGASNKADYLTYQNSTSSGSWNGHFLNLGSKGGLRTKTCVGNDPLTMEAWFRFNKIDDAEYTIFSTYMLTLALGKSSAGTAYDGKLYCHSRGNVLTGDGLLTPELNKPYYVVIRASDENGLDIKIQPDEYTFADTTPVNWVTSSSTWYTCVGTLASASSSFTTSKTYTDGLEIGMMRAWTRWLSDEEIEENYKELKVRFELETAETPSAPSVFTPTKIFDGVSYYVDAQCNTRHGYDASTPKLEPLIITPNDSETSSCNYSTVYASGYTGAWTDDGFLNLGSAGAFKTNHRTYNDEITVEAVFRLNENSVGKQCCIFHACNPSITRTASTHASYPNKLVCTGITTDAFELDELFEPEINKIYYVVNTYDASTTTTTLIILPDNRRWSASLKKFETGLNGYTTCIGTTNFRTTTIATADLYSDGLEIGMVRCWNRVLSDEEIEENYKELKNRFGF